MRTKKEVEIKRRKDRENGYKSVDFQSYFDTSLGEKVWKRDQYKAAEAQGMTMMSHSEAERYAKRAMARRKEKARQEWRKQARPVVSRMLKGESISNIIKSQDIAGN